MSVFDEEFIPHISHIPVIRRKDDSENSSKSVFKQSILACMRMEPDIIFMGELASFNYLNPYIANQDIDGLKEAIQEKLFDKDGKISYSFTSNLIYHLLYRKAMSLFILLIEEFPKLEEVCHQFITRTHHLVLDNETVEQLMGYLNSIKEKKELETQVGVLNDWQTIKI